MRICDTRTVVVRCRIAYNYFKHNAHFVRTDESYEGFILTEWIPEWYLSSCLRTAYTVAIFPIEFCTLTDRLVLVAFRTSWLLKTVLQLPAHTCIQLLKWDVKSRNICLMSFGSYDGQQSKPIASFNQWVYSWFNRITIGLFTVSFVGGTAQLNIRLYAYMIKGFLWLAQRRKISLWLF